MLSLVALLPLFRTKVVQGDVAVKVVYQGNPCSLPYRDLRLFLDNPDNEVAALHVAILYDTDSFDITDMDKTDRSREMDIFNFSRIQGGIRFAMTGIGHSIAPGRGAVATLDVDILHDCCLEGSWWEIAGCVAADPYGTQLLCIEVSNTIPLPPDGCIIGIDPATFEFGEVRIGETRTHWLDIRNIGNWPGYVTIRTSGCVWVGESDLEIQPGATDMVAIGCSPVFEGLCEGTLTLGGCACCNCEEPIQVTCTGIGCGRKGDVNGDGQINVLDLVMVRNHILDVRLIPVERLCRADCQTDRTIDVADVMSLVKVITGRGGCQP